MDRLEWSRKLREGARSRPVLLPAIGIAFLLLILRAAQQSPDALEYAFNARTGHDQVHPHHIIFVPALRLVMAGLAGFGRGTDAILAGQIHNVVWAVVALVALYALVRQFTGSSLLAAGAGCGLLFTRGFWVYATRVEIYVPALAALLWTAWLMAAGTRRQSRGRGLAAGAVLATAVLYHQSSVLFALPLCAFCVAARGRAGWRDAAVVTGVGALLTLGGYVAAFLAVDGHGGIAGFVNWLFSYATMPVPAWGSFAHFGAAGWRDLLRSQAADLTGVPARLSPLIVAAMALAMLALAIWNAAALRRPDPARPLRLLALGWLVVHDAFFLWWLPSDVDFFVVSLAPLVLLAALAVHDVAARRRWVPRAAVAFVGLLAVGNGAASIIPLHSSPGAEYARAAHLDRLAPAGYAIGARFGVRENLCYHFGRTALDPDLPLLWAFAGRDPTATRVETFDRIMLPVGMLAVDHEVGGQTAKLEPRGWARWLCWLLDVRRDAGGDIASCREVAWADGGATHDCALIGPGRVAVTGLDGVVAHLDVRLGLDGKEPWGSWLSEARASGHEP